MCNDAVIRRFAGAFVLLSLALGWWVSPWWFLFTAFVGVNLIQSSGGSSCSGVGGRHSIGADRRSARTRKIKSSGSKEQAPLARHSGEGHLFRGCSSASPSRHYSA
jgi:hypothetical protein